MSYHKSAFNTLLWSCPNILFFASRRIISPLGIAIFLLVQLTLQTRAQTSTDHTYATQMWYAKPAINWNEALPIGNGRLGAMIHGGVLIDKIQLNEQTLWSGGPKDGNNPEASKYLTLVRQAALNGQYKKADSLSKFMQGPYTESYMPMADVIVTHTRINDSVDYRRELDLDKALSSVSFKDRNATYKRTSFASHPDDVLIIHYTSSGNKSISFSVGLSSKLRYVVKSISAGHIALTGKCPKHVEPAYLWRIKTDDAIKYADDPNGEGMNFEVDLKVVQSGGKINIVNNQIVVESSDEATLLISAATSFNGYDQSPGLEGKDPSVLAQGSIKAASEKKYASLERSHIADYQSLFRRMSIDLGVSSNKQLPTDARLKLMKSYTDREIVATVVQYGRYLLIAGSRPEGQPLNLKGIWNERLRPEYSSNWCIDHDAQMFYYAVETSNLSELHLPFLQFIRDLSVNGEKTASINYGMKGWCAHHNTDIWRPSNPVGNFGEGNPHWATWNMSGPWLSAHMFEHYLFTGDKEFLKNEAWPVMKGAAEFCLDWLITGTDGKLISVPSVSPENTFITNKKDTAQISINSTSDLALMKELFRNCIAVAEVLKTDKPFVAELRAALLKLPDYKVGSNGQLLEWNEEWQPADPSHRHLSHMYPVFPGSEVLSDKTGTLTNSAKVALSMRTKTNCTWGFSWKAACWARLGEADSAWNEWKEQLRYVDPNSGSSVNNYGLFPNFFNSDGKDVIMNGNGCATAVMMEMLVQSSGGEIKLLPALPGVFPTGNVRGICTRGGFIVDLEWRNGTALKGKIHSRLGGECKITTAKPIKVYKNGSVIGTSKHGKNGYVFATQAGDRFEFESK
ncbi:MAG: glycoside hydrolase family 95 protein [Chryseolinea sp.]